MDLSMPIVVLLLLAGAFLLLWFGFFIVNRPRLRIAMFVSALGLFAVTGLLVILVLSV